MAKKDAVPVSGNTLVTDLLHQLREASTPEAQRDVMVKSILAGRNNEISVAEGKMVSQEFVRINADTQVRLKAARQTAD